MKKTCFTSYFPLLPNTVFKKCNDGIVLAGLKKTVGNNQVNNIVNALRTIGAWDIDDLDTLKNIPGENVAAITELANFIQQEFSQGAKISLDMLSAFKQFIFTNATELETLAATLNLTDKDLFDALRAYLQDAISAWREEQVTEKLNELTKEFGVIAVLKSETGADIKTYRAMQNTLNNVFEHMKVPGTVVETLSFSWLPALKYMRCISKTAWADIANKDSLAACLQGNAKTAWENLSQPKLLLECVLNARNISFTDDELNEIYMQLKQQTYETPVSAFDANLNRLLENISYIRDTALLKQRWQDNSGAMTIREWCNSSNVPIGWLFDDADLAAIRTINTVQDGRTVEKDALQKAIAFLKDNAMNFLKDSYHITNRFFAQ